MSSIETSIYCGGTVPDMPDLAFLRGSQPLKFSSARRVFQMHGRNSTRWIHTYIYESYAGAVVVGLIQGGFSMLLDL